MMMQQNCRFNLICFKKVKKDETYKLFTQTNIEQRLFDIIEVIKKRFHLKFKRDNSKSKLKNRKNSQRLLLKEQIKAIQKELGGDNQKMKR